MSRLVMRGRQNWYAKLRAVLITCFLSVFLLHPVWADDIEIYLNSATGGSAEPNLLFILDASLSMRRFDCLDGSSKANSPCGDGSKSGTTRRVERMVDAMEQVLSTLPDNFNVGLMRFGGFDGGRVIYPMSRLGDTGVRDAIDDVLTDDLDLALGTPTVGAVEEAWRYYTGRPVFHGTARARTHRTRDQEASRVSHPGSYTGGVVMGSDASEHITGSPVYTAPAASECLANHAILLTDGGPYNGGVNAPPEYTQSIATIEGLNGFPCDTNILENDGVCGEEMARYMFVNDNIITHTIGFNIRSSWIQDVAAAGNGSYFEASSSTDLINALTSITSQILDTGSTVVAPSVTIDQFTRLSHREEVYLALFQPRSTANWSGNLKRYAFNGENPTLRDRDGNVAVDPATGEFLPGSRSFWSENPDGESVTEGGAASRLNKNTRKMYSYLASGVTDLTSIANRIGDINVNFSPALIGAADVTERNTFLDWLSGVDVQDEDGDNDVTDARNHLGDPLHSTPVVVPYDAGNGAEPNSLVFFGTNEGFLHAVNTVDGTEEYAFMPPELLSNVPRLFANESLTSFGTVTDSTGAGVLVPVSASQSSTSSGGVPNRAIDGNTSGVYGQGSVTHTAGSKAVAWWETDLGAVASIADVEIWNRTDGCCTSRLSDFYVFVSETPFVSDDLNTILNDPAVWSTFHPGTLSGVNVNFPVGATGQYIRIQKLTGATALSLAEVIVTGGVNTITAASTSKIYGMDGELTLRTIDNNNNGFIEDSASDKAYVYAGMRRGGRNYYALDVSKKSQPEFLWSIIGGTGDFAELGQSWSKPILTQVQVGTDVKDVLVFGGGYDVNQDFKSQRSPDSVGRAIYIVDADTGDLIWSGGHPQNQPQGSNRHFEFPEMQYSIPSDLTIVTDPSSNLLSQIYVGDMGGRIFRFDIDNGSAIANLVDGGVIADFGVDASDAGARRFYHAPDLSLSRIEGELTLNIAIGSGYRAHPLNVTNEDKFFVFQYPLDGHGTNYGIDDGGFRAIVPDDLFDATSNVIGEGTQDQIELARETLADSEGWFITMEAPGEKILSSSSTFEGVVRFVSYVPVNTIIDPCDPGLGHSFFYAVNLLDGTPFEDINDGQPDADKKSSRRRQIPTPGIAPGISTIFVEHNGKVTPTDVSGLNAIFEWENVDLLRRWFWAESPE